MDKTDLVEVAKSPSFPDREEGHLRCPLCRGEGYQYPIELHDAALAAHARAHSLADWEDQIDQLERSLEDLQSRNKQYESWYEKRIEWMREWRNASEEKK